jgi:hypothetical protein
MKCRRSKTSKGARLRPKNAHGRPAPSGAVPGSAMPESQVPPTNQPAAAAELRIDHHTQGAIRHPGSVIVGPQGVVCGPVHARVIIIEGEVTGDLHADEAIRIIGRGRVHGDVHAPRVAMASGAQLRGRLTMPRRPEPATVSE